MAWCASDERAGGNRWAWHCSTGSVYKDAALSYVFSEQERRLRYLQSGTKQPPNSNSNSSFTYRVRRIPSSITWSEPKWLGDQHIPFLHQGPTFLSVALPAAPSHTTRTCGSSHFEWSSFAHPGPREEWDGLSLNAILSHLQGGGCRRATPV